MIMSTSRSQDYRTSIGYLSHLHELQPGDILLFRASLQPNSAQYFIMFLQAILSYQKHGHYDTTHVAMCVGDIKGEPILAHVTENSKFFKYIKEPIEDMLSREILFHDRPFLVFRPKDRLIAKAYAEVASHDKNQSLNWSLAEGFKTFLSRTHLDESAFIEQAERITNNVICSQFIIEIIQEVTQNQEKIGLINHLNYFPKIKPTSSPKALESELYNNPEYQLLCYTGKESIYKMIKMEIKAEISRLKQKTGTNEIAKYNSVLTDYKNIRKSIRKIHFDNELEKSLYLLKKITPSLNIKARFFTKNTGWFAANSYKNVIASARKLGIFNREIENFDCKPFDEQLIKSTIKKSKSPSDLKSDKPLLI